MKGAEGFSWCEGFLLFGKRNRAQDLLLSPPCSFAQSSHLTVSNKCLKKTASTRLAALTGPFSLGPPESCLPPFSFLQIPRGWKGRLQGKPSSARHDENFKWGIVVRMSPIIKFQSQQKPSVGPESADVFTTVTFHVTFYVSKQEETTLTSLDWLTSVLKLIHVPAVNPKLLWMDERMCCPRNSALLLIYALHDIFLTHTHLFSDPLGLLLLLTGNVKLSIQKKSPISNHLMNWSLHVIGCNQLVPPHPLTF